MDRVACPPIKYGGIKMAAECSVQVAEYSLIKR